MGSHVRELAASLPLVVITDAELVDGRPLESVVREALEGGCRCIQLRDKSASARALFEQATALRALTLEFDALLIINDRFDVALASGADGVHVGPADVPVGVVRNAVPASFVIGASCDDLETARQLVAFGADYLGCGTVFPTPTKPDAGAAIGVDQVRTLASGVDVPVVAIGGIAEDEARVLSGSGVAGIAVVSAVMSAASPRRATRALLEAFGPATHSTGRRHP